MRKLILVILFFWVIFISGCTETGNLTIDLSKGYNEIKLVPKYSSTTTCDLEIYGNIDCQLLVKIDYQKSLNFNPGKINFYQSYEWYEKGGKIKFYSDSCKDSKIKLKYRFSSRYFGQK